MQTSVGINFEELNEFKSDFKKLIKKYRTLNTDLFVLKKVLEQIPDQRPPFSYMLDNLDLNTCVIKVKKIACRAIKTRGVNTGLRLVYAYFKDENRIIFIEIYHKNVKSKENRQRIKYNFK